MSATLSDAQALCTIRVPERFDFSFHNEFRESYEKSTASQFVLDMRQTNYMDSSALGMLLQLKERSSGKADAVKIVNVRPEIRQILEIANFDKLFSID